jgi:hypothetical protein
MRDKSANIVLHFLRISVKFRPGYRGDVEELVERCIGGRVGSHCD